MVSSDKSKEWVTKPAKETMKKAKVPTIPGSDGL